MSKASLKEKYGHVIEVSAQWFHSYRRQLNEALILLNDLDCEDDPALGIDFSSLFPRAAGQVGARGEEVVPVVLSRSGIMVRQRNYLLVDPKMPFLYAMTVGALLGRVAPTVRIDYQILELLLSIPVTSEPAVLGVLEQELSEIVKVGSSSESTILLPLPAQCALGGDFSGGARFTVRATRAGSITEVVLNDPPETYENAISGGVAGLYLGRALSKTVPTARVIVELTSDVAMVVVPASS